jgi:glycine dehydrogenase subunit 1
VQRAFGAPIFHECVVKLPTPVERVLQAMRANGILGGFNLAKHYPELGHALLVCATETKTPQDLEMYSQEFSRGLGGMRARNGH